MSKTFTKVEFDVIDKLKNGVDTIANAVKSTLGPSGNNVIIETLSGPIITKDGVTVARSITLEDKTENLAAHLIKMIAMKTVDEAGDGTTTSTILAQSLFNEGCKLLQYNGNKIKLKNEIEKTISKVIEKLKDKVQVITLDKNGENINLQHVANISSNGDKDMSKTIVDAFKLVGKEGIISVEESSINGYSVEKADGLQIEAGYVNPYFMTDSRKLECEFFNPLIMIYKGEIGNAKEIELVLNYSVKNGKPLVIFADNFSDNAQEILIKNKIQGNIQICLNKVSGWGQTKDAIYDDISALTGAFPFAKGDDLSNIDFKRALGSASKININRNVSNIIASDNLDKTIYNEVISKIQHMIKETSNKVELERLNERLGKLTGGVAIIKVGGATAVEIHEKKDRVDDAVCATRAALEEGILVGGGISLYKIMNEIEDDNSDGYKIVRSACLSPVKTLCENCGMSYEYVDSLLKNAPEFNQGIDFSNKDYLVEDIFVKGIIDPFKVTRVALEAASSIVGLLLTTNYTVTLKEVIDQNNLV